MPALSSAAQIPVLLYDCSGGRPQKRDNLRELRIEESGFLRIDDRSSVAAADSIAATAESALKARGLEIEDRKTAYHEGSR